MCIGDRFLYNIKFWNFYFHLITIFVLTVNHKLFQTNVKTRVSAIMNLEYSPLLLEGSSERSLEGIL
jgi:hypothetical protein